MPFGKKRSLEALEDSCLKNRELQIICLLKSAALALCICCKVCFFFDKLRLGFFLDSNNHPDFYLYSNRIEICFTLILKCCYFLLHNLALFYFMQQQYCYLNLKMSQLTQWLSAG